ncbi:MAG: UDP-N-acetylglucosamine 2-epimerase (non-hydrolyzing) [Acidobacteria bacterium]|nr:UDP-N-acetylglucosamine 2-epimerase (non-hydrolyzing) [Acidobacteriota bacterium]
MHSRPVIGVVFGTRPEAIKLAPVIFELRRSANFELLLISTAQHRQMLDQVLDIFGIMPDLDLDLMTRNQTLGGLTCRVLQSMDELLQQRPLDCLIVQGDTTTAFAAAVAAFYRKVPVAHIEAGLRTGDLLNPYPEEANRKLVSALARLHFAPTPLARANLLEAGADAGQIAVTGNTVVDALQVLVERGAADHPLPPGIPNDGRRLVLLTSHRRESWGEDLENICRAVADLVAAFEDIRVVYPVHMNPNVRRTVGALLEDIDRVHLTAPLDYFQFLSLLRRSHLVLTDSGGVQEEAPSFGKPVLVLRKVTERPEAALRGLSVIVGTSRERIVNEASRLLSCEAAFRAMSNAENPYGDGRASARIAESLARWWHGELPLLPPELEFAGTGELEPAMPNAGRAGFSDELERVAA